MKRLSGMRSAVDDVIGERETILMWPHNTGNCGKQSIALVASHPLSISAGVTQYQPIIRCC
jgi:hypothetical protein